MRSVDVTQLTSDQLSSSFDPIYTLAEGECTVDLTKVKSINFLNRSALCKSWLCSRSPPEVRQWRTGGVERHSACRSTGSLLSGANTGAVRVLRAPHDLIEVSSGTDIARVVHAKAAGAFGFFEVTDDVSDLTSARWLSEVGKKTELLTRISTVGGEKGSADTVRDVRGWSIKFFTEDGNQDMVMNDLPVFFLRDPIKFPSMNRSHKKHPRTNVPDNTMFWDYHVNNPEGMHALMHLFGQRGIPESLRHIVGYSVHTYTLSREDGSFVYVKWTFRPEGGVTTLDAATAASLAGSDPDYHVKDLFNAIENSDYPTWLLYLQVMKPEDVAKAAIDIFDPTFTWPQQQYPLRRVGRLTLNRNVSRLLTMDAD
jgi:catalase